MASATPRAAIELLDGTFVCPHMLPTTECGWCTKQNWTIFSPDNPGGL